MQTLLTVDDGHNWDAVLNRCNLYDAYHLAAYHRVTRNLGQGEPYLFVFEDNGRTAAMPFVRRSLIGIEGIDDRRELYDATSVYGYPGVISSVTEESTGARAFATSFQSALREALRDLGVLALFLRSNPLVENLWLLDGIADIRVRGHTIAMDLALSDSEYRKSINSNTRRNLTKVHRNNLAVAKDSEMQRIEDFIHIYEQTMKRVSARQDYFFPQKYYQELKMNLANKAILFHAKHCDQVIAAMLVFAHGRIVQYHLGGTREGFLALSPMVALFDFVRRWGRDEGFSWFHLGGGVGGAKDSLYRFKAGFSKREFDFRVAEAVLLPDEYARACEERWAWLEQSGGQLLKNDFFPTYRAPVKSMVEDAIHK